MALVVMLFVVFFVFVAFMMIVPVMLAPPIVVEAAARDRGAGDQRNQPPA